MFTLSTTFADGTIREKQYSSALETCDRLIDAYNHWTAANKPCTIQMLDHRGYLIFETKVEPLQTELFDLF